MTSPTRIVEYRGGGPDNAPDPRMGWAWLVLALFLVGTLLCTGGCPGSTTPAQRLAVAYCGATELCQRAWFQLHYSGTDGPDAARTCAEDAYVEVLDLGLRSEEAEELLEILQGAVVEDDCGAYYSPSLVYGIGAVAGNLGIYGSQY